MSYLYIHTCVIALFLLSVESTFVNSTLPMEIDLNEYLKTIEETSRYCTENKNEIDIHLAFGLFLSIVNLKYSLNEKGKVIPYDYKTRMENIISENEQSLQYYKENLFENGSDRVDLLINRLFSNVSRWISRLEDFDTNRVVKTFSPNELNKRYSYWNRYLHEVDRFEHWTPTPNESDDCLVSLSMNPVNDKPSLSWCPLKNPCYFVLLNGTDFGYAICHRILILLMARMAHGCSILSANEDRQLTQKLCSLVFAEAQYIAMNKYQNVDLMLEGILLCSLEGNAEFLRRKWLKNIIKFQTSGGCFYLNGEISKPDLLNYSGGNRYKTNSDKECNAHTTALASGTYSSAIRLILQEYY